MAIPQETLDYYEAFSPSRRKGKDVKEDLSKFNEQSLKSTMDSSSIIGRQSQSNLMFSLKFLFKIH